MQTLKTLVVLGVLGIVGYGLYVGLNNGFEFAHNPPPTPPWIQEQISGQQGIDPTPPAVDLGFGQSPTLESSNSGAAGAAPNNNNSPYAYPSAQHYPAQPPTAPPEVAPLTATPPTAQYPGVLGNPPAIPGHNGLADTQTPPTQGPQDTYLPSTNGTTHDTAPGASLASPLAGSVMPGDPMANISLPDPAPAVTSDIAGTNSAEVGSAFDPPASVDASQPEFSNVLADARSKLDQGDFKTALLDLSMWYKHPDLTPDQHNELVVLLDQAAGSAIYSGQHLLEPPHITSSNESLNNVAAKYGIPPGLIAKINGLSLNQPLTPGQQLKVVRGPFYGVIDTQEKELTLYIAARYAGRFNVDVGPEFESIVGNFVVTNKTRSHAQNLGMPYIQLGIGFSETPSTADKQLAIAGVTDGQAYGAPPAQGTIRVSRQDADDLIDILSEGSRITIRR